MSILGTGIADAIGAFGSKPKVPELPTIDPTKIQSQTVAGNIANFDEIAKLGSQVNRFNQEELQKLIDSALPGGREKITANINSQLSGELPQDVIDQIRKNSASYALDAGFGGSAFARNLTARDLGLTSYQMTQEGLSSAAKWLSVASPPQFDPTAMFFSPQQRLNFAMADRTERFNRDLMAAQVKAAPDPGTAAMGREIDRFFNTWASFGMGALGSMGGMGGGGGMMGGASAGGGGGSSYIGRSGMSGMDWLQAQENGGSANGAHI